MPITEAAHGATKAQGAVIASRPAGMPLHGDGHGLDKREGGGTPHLHDGARRARRPGRGHRAPRLRRPVGGFGNRHRRRTVGLLRRVLLRPHRPCRRPLRRHLGAWRCGAWGVLAVGIFADGTYGDGWNGVSGPVKGLIYGDGGQLVAQAAHVVIGFLWAWGVTWLIFVVAKRFTQIRVSPQAELEGLDMPEFGALCYPDFVLATTKTGGHAPASHEQSAGPAPAFVGHEPAVTSSPPPSPGTDRDVGRPQ